MRAPFALYAVFILKIIQLTGNGLYCLGAGGSPVVGVDEDALVYGLIAQAQIIMG